MGKTIAVFNQKGGVSKTTTVTNLLAALAEKGKKVLGVDMDPQANATNGLGINDKDLTNCVYQLMHGKCTLDDILIHTKFKVDMIPSNISLADAEITLANVLSRETVLNRKLEQIKQEYDYIIIDCPPSLGLLSINALVAADYLIIPISPEYYSVTGMENLINTYNLVKNNLKPTLDILGVVITRYDQRIRLSKDIRSTLKAAFSDKVFNTILRENADIKYAQDKQRPINYHNIKSFGYEDIMNFADEVINNVR